MNRIRRLIGMTLALFVASTAPAQDDAVPHPLADTRWELVTIQEMDDSSHTPEDASKYTLVRSYVLRDGHLFLATMADGSIIEFRPVGATVTARLMGQDITETDPEAVQAACVTFDPLATALGAEMTVDLGVFQQGVGIPAILVRSPRTDVARRARHSPPLRQAERRPSRAELAGLADDVRYYGKWMRDEAEKRLGQPFPEIRVASGAASASLPPLSVVAMSFRREG